VDGVRGILFPVISTMSDFVSSGSLIYISNQHRWACRARHWHSFLLYSSTSTHTLTTLTITRACVHPDWTSQFDRSIFDNRRMAFLFFLDIVKGSLVAQPLVEGRADCFCLFDVQVLCATHAPNRPKERNEAAQGYLITIAHNLLIPLLLGPL